MPFSLVLQTVLPVFLIILAGFIMGKYKKINTQLLTDLVVYIAGPCLIISSISRSDIGLDDFFAVSAGAAAVTLIMGFFVFLILKISRSNKEGLYLPMVIGNTGFIGYPVALFAFGAAGLSRAVVYDMIGSLFLFSIGIYIISKKHGFKEAFKTPLIYAVIIGLLINLMKIPLPDYLFKPVEMIGMITIPLALLILGYKLTEIRMNHIITAFLASLFRIVAGFLVAFAFVKIFSIKGLSGDIIILQSAMPSAVMSMILTAKYNKDAACVASVVLITTVASLASIPLVLWFLSL